MPQPGDVCPGFLADPPRCWRMVYSPQLQADHCRTPVDWTGRCRSPKLDRWWIVGACDAHTDGLTGLRRLAPIRR